MTEPMHVKENWPTLADIAGGIPKIDLANANRGRGRPKTRDGHIGQHLEAAQFPTRSGLHEISPSELLSVYVPIVGINGDDNNIVGFQRTQVRQHIRDIARAMLKGSEIPPITITIDPETDIPYVCDGQHRALGAIAADQTVYALVRKRTFAESRALFTNQARARTLKFDDTLITGSSPVELYIQDALTDVNHPWHPLVSMTGGKGKMSPTTMAIIVGSYVHNTLNQGVKYYISRQPHEFNPQHGHELAFLIKAFGNAKTNPLAFKATSLRNLTSAAVHVFRRNPNVHMASDMERWQRHMPTFQFQSYVHLLNQREMIIAMITHWNKRLSVDRQVHINTLA